MRASGGAPQDPYAPSAGPAQGGEEGDVEPLDDGEYPDENDDGTPNRSLFRAIADGARSFGRKVGSAWHSAASTAKKVTTASAAAAKSGAKSSAAAAKTVRQKWHDFTRSIPNGARAAVHVQESKTREIAVGTHEEELARPLLEVPGAAVGAGTLLATPAGPLPDSPQPGGAAQPEGSALAQPENGPLVSPPEEPPQEIETWQTGICNCCDAPGVMFEVLFCHPCNVSYQYTAVRSDPSPQLREEQRLREEHLKRKKEREKRRAERRKQRGEVDGGKEKMAVVELGNKAFALLSEVVEGPEDMNPVPCLAVIVFDIMALGLGTLLASVYLRSEIRYTYNIQADRTLECCFGCFCFPFSLCQTHRELKLRGRPPGQVCGSNFKKLKVERRERTGGTDTLRRMMMI